MAQAAKQLKKIKDIEAQALQEQKEKEESNRKRRNRSRDRKKKGLREEGAAFQEGDGQGCWTRTFSSACIIQEADSLPTQPPGKPLMDHPINM